VRGVWGPLLGIHHRDERRVGPRHAFLRPLKHAHAGRSDKIAEDVKEKVAEVAEQAKEVVEDAVENVTEAASAVQEKAEEKAEQVQERAAETVESAKEGAADAAEAAADTMTAAVAAVTGVMIVEFADGKGAAKSMEFKSKDLGFVPKRASAGCCASAPKAGVVVDRVEKNKQADKLGVKKGWAIKTINGTEVAGLEEARKALEDGKANIAEA